MHWRRKWQPIRVFLPGESQGRGSLLGCCLWGHTESDTPEATQQQFYKCPTFYSMHSLLNSLVSSYFCSFLKQRKDIILSTVFTAHAIFAALNSNTNIYSQFDTLSLLFYLSISIWIYPHKFFSSILLSFLHIQIFNYNKSFFIIRS